MKKKGLCIFVLCLLVVVLLEVIMEIVIYKRGNETKDNILFYRQYPEVGQDNIYKIVDIDKAIDIFQNDTGIVLVGFPSCKWCQKFAVVLNEAAKEYDVESIYYLDIKYHRKNSTEEYMELVNIIREYLELDENQNPILYVPDVYFIKNGSILGHNNETAMLEDIELDEYYTEENRSELKQNLIEYIKQISPAVCNDTTYECN